MPETPQGIQGFFKGETAGLPNWAWVVVIVVGIGAAVLVPRLFKGTGSSQDTTSTGDQSGGGIGLAIDPTTGLPYAVEGLVPSGGVGGGGGATNGTGGSTGGGMTQPPPPASGLIPISGDADNDDFFDLSTGTVIKVPKGTTPTSTTGGTTGTSTGTSTTSPTTAKTPPTPTKTPTPTKPVAPPTAKPTKPAALPAKPATPPTKVPSAPIAQYATVRAWPDPMSTLSGIASQSGISLARIEQLNPQITNPNTIYPGQKIRIM